MNLVDYDTVDETNLPRQIIYKPNQIGMNKAIAAKKVLSDFNPEVNISAYDERMMGDNLHNLVNESDLVIDATDNLSFQTSDQRSMPIYENQTCNRDCNKI